MIFMQSTQGQEIKNRQRVKEEVLNMIDEVETFMVILLQQGCILSRRTMKLKNGFNSMLSPLMHYRAFLEEI
jgi:hypothetical protein